MMASCWRFLVTRSVRFAGSLKSSELLSLEWKVEPPFDEDNVPVAKEEVVVVVLFFFRGR